MLIEQRIWTSSEGWRTVRAAQERFAPQLVLLFGSPAALRSTRLLAETLQAYPQAELVGCSTAGEILDTHVLDESVVTTAVQFEHTRIRVVDQSIQSAEESNAAGAAIARQLLADDLAHVLVLSEGISVNGSELVRGLTSVLPRNVAATGGLAGDADRFQETLLYRGDRITSNLIVGVGFYGDRLNVGYGSLGGWDQFGPERLITRARANVLYELDGEPALALYKRYLGAYAEELPASGLLFPLSLRVQGTDHRIVRTILGVDENEKSLTFAGDVPEGAYARLMKANVDRLIDGAMGAAQLSEQALGGSGIQLAILISCVGRKLVLKQRVEEEVECVRETFGNAALVGFYSYGEILPFTPNARCELHNQTMTITALSER